MNGRVLKSTREAGSNDILWGVDSGKSSIEEGVLQGDQFLHEASRLIPAKTEKDKSGKVSPAGFVLETLFNAACPHGEQRHGLRYLTLS